jgi:oligoendopeptidase F
MRHRQLLLTAFIALLAANTVVAAEEVTVDPSHTWDLSDMYPSIEAWNQAREEVTANFEKIEQRRGSLGKSANDLYQTLQLISDAYKKNKGPIPSAYSIAATGLFHRSHRH